MVALKKTFCKLVPLYGIWSQWLVLVYLLSIVLLVVLTYIFGPWHHIDTHTYIQAARHYAEGDFIKGVNGYWSPLYSWLIIPLTFIPIEPVWYARIVNGFFALLAVSLLAFILNKSFEHLKSNHQRIATLVVHLSLSPLLIIWSVNWLTPDFMSGVIATFAIYIAMKLVSKPSRKLAVGLGLLLLLLLFAKSIGFVFAGAILLTLLVIGFSSRSRGLIIHTIIASAIFAFGVLAWSSVLYAKYGVFNFSTAGQHNINLAGPGSRYKHQIDKQNAILDLPYSNSSSAWDDPTYLPLETWSIIDNWQYFMGVLGKNASVAAMLFLSAPVVLVSALVVFLRIGRVNRWLVLTPCAAVLLAYIPMLVEQRYMFMVWIPIILFGASVVTRCDGRQRRSYKITLNGYLVAAVLSASLAVGSMSMKQTSLTYIRNAHASQVALDGSIPTGSIVAVRSVDMMYYCVAMELRCLSVNYKIGSGDVLVKSQLSDLAQNGIDYYISRSSLGFSVHDLLVDWYVAGRTSVAPAGIYIYKTKAGP